MTQRQQNTLELISAYGGSFLIPSGNDCIGNLLKVTGQFETDDIRSVGEYLRIYSRAESKRLLFIDIGANIGTHSVAALTQHGYLNLLAIEPSEENYRLLTANLCLNGLMERATCIQAAASDHTGQSTLFHNANNCGDHRLNNNPNKFKIDATEDSEQVKMTNAFDLLSQHTREICLFNCLCWIDTQGHEIPILRTLQPLIELGLPTVIEFWPHGMEQQGGSIKELISILQSPRLKLAKISNTGIESISLEDLEKMWACLRAQDSGIPEEAAYCNILIHSSPMDAAIAPEEMDRIMMTSMCRDSQPIPKIPGAGEVVTDDEINYQLMHNGLKVLQGGYYGAWMCELIKQLEGHHEPQEERVFHEILSRTAHDGLMIEIGCYWAYYSLWFLKDHPLRKSIGLEPDANHLVIAEKNAKLNNLEKQIHLVHGLSSENSQDSLSIETESGQTINLQGYTLLDLLNFSDSPHIEIAHCDAQGAESHVVDQAIELGKQGRLRFCIISTHAYEITGDPLTHQTCLKKLQAADAHIIAEHDVHESYSGDGMIAVSFSPKDVDLSVVLSCNRYSTSLFPNPAAHFAAALQEIESLKQVEPPQIESNAKLLEETKRPSPGRLDQLLNAIFRT
jgi:FkbM family methyltransferase